MLTRPSTPEELAILYSWHISCRRRAWVERLRYACRTQELNGRHADSLEQFADARTAYDDLSEDMKKRLEGLVANHSLFHSRKTAQPEYFKDMDPSKMALSKHKLIQEHEWSGRMVSLADFGCECRS